MAEGDAAYKWFSTALNASLLFGLLPAYLLKLFNNKKSILLGGILLIVSLILSYVMVKDEGRRKDIANNSTLILFVIAVLGGQGAALTLMALLQSVLDSMSVLCCHFVAGLMMSYFFGGPFLLITLKHGLLGSGLSLFILIGAIVAFIAGFILLEDAKEEEGGSGLSLDAFASVTAGILNKKTATGHILINAVLALLYIFVYAYDWEYSSACCIVILVLWLLNLVAPLILLAMLDEEAIKEMIGKPEDFETKLMMEKGKDGEQGTTDFWLLCLATAFNVSIAFTISENAGTLALRNVKNTTDMIQLQQVFTVVGATLTGAALFRFRENIEPATTFMAASLFSLIAALHMAFLAQGTSYIVFMGIFIFSGLALGTNFVAIASFCFEEYGVNGFAYTYGTFSTCACVAFLIMDQLLFEFIYWSYKKESTYNGKWDNLRYGNWNAYIGYAFATLSLISLASTYIGKNSWKDRQDSGAGAALAAAGDMLKKVDVKLPSF